MEILQQELRIVDQVAQTISGLRLFWLVGFTQSSQQTLAVDVAQQIMRRLRDD